MRTGVQDRIRFLALAGADAGRAWAIAPIRDFYRDDKEKRPFTWGERLKIKYKAARSAWRYSQRLRTAQALVIRQMGAEGLLANLLRVIEALHRVRPGADVHVDWTLDGSEIGFRYGAIGSDVWASLFRPIGTVSRPGALHARQGIDLALWGTGKDYLAAAALRRHREAYHRTISKWIEVTNQNVLSRIQRTQADHFQGRFCLGVHRRVASIGVAELQRGGALPCLDRLLARCGALLQASGDPNARIFLATDDSQAAEAFQSAFGARLIVQQGIKRTIATRREVHFGDWRTMSLADAEDVLVDMLLLSRCNMLVHASSSVSTAASLFNPGLPLIRLYDDK